MTKRKTAPAPVLAHPTTYETALREIRSITRKPHCGGMGPLSRITLLRRRIRNAADLTLDQRRELLDLSRAIIPAALRDRVA